MKTRTTSYHTWAPVTAALGFLLACSSSGAPAGGASTGGPTPAPNVQNAAVPSGPLPLLASQGQRVSYVFEGTAKELLDYPADNVKVSASCAKPDGSLDCEAMRLLRGGKKVQLTPAELSVGIAPGAVACRKLQLPSTVGRAPNGNEDGFCELADGSLVGHGSVEAHVIAP